MNLGENWFDYAEFYDELALSFGNRTTFIEVGSWLGRSIIHLAKKLQERQIWPKIYCVDVWSDCVKEEAQLKFIKDLGGPNKLFDQFISNCNEAGVGEMIWPIRSSSVRVSTFFNNNTVDCIFLDAGHTYEDVCSDILHWFRVVKKGGILAGHDYDSAPVIKAVHDSLGKENIIEKPGHVWYYIKKE